MEGDSVGADGAMYQWLQPYDLQLPEITALPACPKTTRHTQEADGVPQATTRRNVRGVPTIKTTV